MPALQLRAGNPLPRLGGYCFWDTRSKLGLVPDMPNPPVPSLSAANSMERGDGSDVPSTSQRGEVKMDPGSKKEGKSFLFLWVFWSVFLFTLDKIEKAVTDRRNERDWIDKQMSLTVVTYKDISNS